MLKAVVEATQLDPRFCAELVRVSPDQFAEWMSEKKPVPGFLLSELSSILGVPASSINGNNTIANEPPAIWFKLRDAKLRDEDRQFVGVVRKFGYYLGQLQQLRGRSTKFESVFAQVRKATDYTANPAIQGRMAAKAFREATGLDQGQGGIGDAIRGHLRSIGILLVESPLPKSDLDGCCFRVGAGSEAAPCIFVNTYKASWFRTNYVLAHELCHAIFDLDNEQVSLDYKSEGTGASTDINENRAQVFADECMVPYTVLTALSNQAGLHWDSLTVDDISFLVAKSHVEQKRVLLAALRHGLISTAMFDEYVKYDCHDRIKEYTDHALTTREYLKKIGAESPTWRAENRKVIVGSRTLRLPAGYVRQVLEALQESLISESKAAEMLMLDRDVFRARFRGQLPAAGQ